MTKKKTPPPAAAPRKRLRKPIPPMVIHFSDTPTPISPKQAERNRQWEIEKKKLYGQLRTGRPAPRAIVAEMHNQIDAIFAVGDVELWRCLTVNVRLWRERAQYCA